MTEGCIRKVIEILDNEGWKYEREADDVLMLVAYLSRKWKMVISCEGGDRICCYAVYPWPVPEEKQMRVIMALNELNMSQRRGCFMLNHKDMRVVYRCGVLLLDEYSSYDYIKELILSSAAVFNAGWEKVHGRICGI